MARYDNQDRTDCMVFPDILPWHVLRYWQHIEKGKAMAQKKAQNKPRRWRAVGMNELQNIWDSLQHRGDIYAGCTHAELLRIYGNGNLIHRIGHGWYKLTVK